MKHLMISLRGSLLCQLAVLLLWSPAGFSQAIVSFSNGSFTDATVLSKAGPPGQVVYGVNFGDTVTRTTSAGYGFGPSNYNNNPNINYVGSPYTAYLSGGGSSGDASFDAVLTRGAVGGGATGALTLNNLIPNATYRVLFLLADTRSGMGSRSFYVTSGTSTSAQQLFSFAGGTGGLGGYVLATFTASGATQTFSVYPGAYGYQLNALLVCRVDDTKLEPVVTTNLPIFTSLTAYNYLRDSDAVSTVYDGYTVPYDQTLYHPFDVTTYQWWDNLISELVQARLPVVMFGSRGAYSTDPDDLIGGLNPRTLRHMVSAMQRNNVTDQFKLTCFVDTPTLVPLQNSLVGNPSGTPVNLANQAIWDTLFWQLGIRTFFDNVPSDYWFRIDGKPVIQFWGIGPPNGSGQNGFQNLTANIRGLLVFLADEFEQAYGVEPAFILDQAWYNWDDPSQPLETLDSVIGNNYWFIPSTAMAGSFTTLAKNQFMSGCLVPGFTAVNYHVPGHPNYGNPQAILTRNKLDGSGQNGDTMIGLLNQAVMASGAKKNLTLIEGWNDAREFAGLYRSTSPRWTLPGKSSFPNLYINILGRYTDLRTVTRRLEAEACDDYSGAGGNPGGVYRRTGTLGIRAFGGMSARTASSHQSNHPPTNAFDLSTGNKWFTSTTAPGWLQYDYGASNSVVVDSYIITSADLQGRDPKDWQFQGSNNGTSWTNLHPVTGEAFPGRYQSIGYSFSNTTAYRYYRLNITANQGGSGHGLAVAELQLTPSSTSFVSGWAVTNTAANQELIFHDIPFSEGNYKFPIRYSATSSRTMRLLIDNVALPDVTLPATGSMDTFQTAYLGVKALTHGTHSLKIVFVNGGVDLDWLFIKKYDPVLSLQSDLTGAFVTAADGGNGNLVATQTTEGDWERFSVNGRSGATGGSVAHGDTVSLQAYNGCYITPAAGGGSTVTAKARSSGAWEPLVMVKVGGSGPIVSGDKVALRTITNHYLTVNGTAVNATGTSVGTAQTFTARLGAQ